MSIRNLALDSGLRNFKQESLPIPEWDGQEVIIRALSAGDWDDYRQAITTTSDDASVDVIGAYALVLSRTLFDPQTAQRVFIDEDAPELARSFSPVHDRLVALAFELSGAHAEADPVEEAGND